MKEADIGNERNTSKMAPKLVEHMLGKKTAKGR